jgi:hypothetical protein
VDQGLLLFKQLQLMVSLVGVLRQLEEQRHLQEIHLQLNSYHWLLIVLVPQMELPKWFQGKIIATIKKLLPGYLKSLISY